MTTVRDAIESVVRRWLPVLNEDRMRLVESLVLELVVEQQNENIERGLRELAANAPECTCGDVPSLRHLDEDGHLPMCPAKLSLLWQGWER